MNYICNTNDCTGCRLCAAVCPNQCISFEKIIQGHFYPVIDGKKCVNCGLCKKYCVAKQNQCDKTKKLYNEGVCYAAWCKDSNEQYESASGGLATLISKNVIHKGGKVYGCLWNEKLEAIHKGVDSDQDLEKLRKSKYTLSTISPEVFKDIKKELKTGRLCLFIGVPCECDAVRKFIGKNHDNLIIIDLLCHGGASPILLKEHIRYLVNKHKLSDINNVTFRGGDYDCLISLRHDNTVEYHGEQFGDEYFRAFMTHIIFRKSCYTCKYANCNRIGDITLADFWGLDAKIVERNNFLKRGVNLLLINNEKGQKIVEEIKDKINLIKRNLSEAIPENETLSNPSPIPDEYDIFWSNMRTRSFEKAMHRTYKEFYRARKKRDFLRRIKMPYWKLRNHCKEIIKYIIQ